MSDAGGTAYSILTNADIPWPTVKLSTGEEVTLDASGYTKYREAPNRDDRKRVMDAFFGAFKTYERTIGRHAVFAAEAGRGLREGAQVPGLDHARARRATDPGRGVRHADRADQRQPADAASLLPAAREDARRAAACTTTTSTRRSCTATSSFRSQAASSWCSTRSRRSARDYVAAVDDGPRPPLDGCLSAAAQAIAARTWTATPTTCTRTC